MACRRYKLLDAVLAADKEHARWPKMTDNTVAGQEAQGLSHQSEPLRREMRQVMEQSQIDQLFM